MSHAKDTFTEVRVLVEAGLSDYQIADATGVPRSTVLRWRRRLLPPGALDLASRWELDDPVSYCYLLGAYLGDGHVTHRPPRSWTLRIATDQQYPAIEAEIVSAMTVSFPGGRPTSRPASKGASNVVSLTHAAVGRAFPQHGPGKKHLRRIELTDWQIELTHAHPAALIRGLIHSDGCRSLNRVRTVLPSGREALYEYVRYFFSNRSGDIRAIFASHCDLLGIRVTQPNPRNLAVSHRDSVQILETIVGPKS
jgi:hypothetical protein